MPANIELQRVDGGRLGRRPAFLTGILARTRPRAAERGLKQSPFEHRVLPYLLLAPQLTALLFFFFIPAFRGLIQAFQLTDPFGGSTQWVGLDNLAALMHSAPYWASVRATFVFTIALSVTTLGIALIFAFAAHHVLR